jgi:hypothetical protein
MNCQPVRIWLLQADTLKPGAWPTEVGDHVAQCASCKKLARKVRKLEHKWRDEQPVAEEIESSKAAFLKKLRKRQKATNPATVPVEREELDSPRETKTKPDKDSRLVVLQFVRWGVGAVSAAAVILVCITALAWLLFSPSETYASTDVVDRLLDLNLQISNAEGKARKRLYDENEKSIVQDLQRARLNEDEREFAEELLENCRFLAENDDPVEEVNRINDIADRIKSREDVASKKGDEKEKEKCKFQLKKMMNMGYNPIIDRISEFKTPEGMKKPGYQAWMKYDPGQQKTLQKLLEQSRDRDRDMFGRPDMRKTLDSMRMPPPPGSKGSPFGKGGWGKGGFGSGGKK